MMDNAMNTPMKKTVKSLLLLMMALPVLLCSQRAEAAERKLAFAVSGVVQSIQVKHGASVKAGTLLAQLDQTTFIARKQAADVAAKSAKLILGLAEVKAQQTRELFDALSTSQEEVDKAESELARAQTASAKAKAKADIAAWKLSRSSLRAPFSGTVSAIAGYPGMVVNLKAGTQTVVIVNAK